MGGKLRKKKERYSVNDENAKNRDKKTEGTGMEEEGIPKGNETQAVMETTEVKESKGEKLEKDAQDTMNKTEEKEDDKDTDVAKEQEPKVESYKTGGAIEANPESQKNTEQKQAATSISAARGDASKATKASANAKAETTALTKEEGEPKKAEAPAAPIALPFCVTNTKTSLIGK